LKALVKALRPQQWVKNLLLFLPLIMAHELLALDKIVATCLAFVAFCLCASSVYVLNDLSDARSDRHHPHKKHRPFASGALPVSWGPPLSALLLTAGFTLACVALPQQFVLALVCYQVLTTLYTFWLKQQVLVDVQMLAGLYTLRILAGGYASQVPVSEWMMGFSVFLFTSLAFAKRYAELARMKDSGGRRRPTGRGYHVADLGLIEVLGPTSGYLAVLVLAMYIHSPTVRALYARPWALWLICPVILYWVSRIWLLARRRQLAEDPVVFAIRDRVSLALGAAVALLLFIAAAPWA
jgi:4-hydroxybenzoate polyprenyltransferase